ncbi:MAG: DUF2806 domain-containing protein [Bacteroidales bacterium]|nr:DUF2806 domain-containing protein [Bacteroidales bacterium]
MADINIIKIEGKPLEKLIDVISKGIGTLYRPESIRKEADAEAYKIDIIERAKNKAIAEGKVIEAETIDKIEERVLNKELHRQQNIEHVAQIAAEQINQEKTVSEEPVDDDWATRFFNIVEDISDEEMQNLWGRILAGEVKQPKSYSLRTLELLKNLTKEEANLFMKVANFSINSAKDSFIFKPENDELSKEFNIKFDDLSQLIEIGLIQPGDFVRYQLLQSTLATKTLFTAGMVLIVVEKKENVPTISFPISLFTKTGKELLKLVNPNPPFLYLTKFAKIINNENVDVKHGLIIEILPDTIRHTIPLKNFIF